MADDFPILPHGASASEAMGLIEKGYWVLRFATAQAIVVRAVLDPLTDLHSGAVIYSSSDITQRAASKHRRNRHVVCFDGSRIKPTKFLAAKTCQEIGHGSHPAFELGGDDLAGD